jgi:DNA-binding protein
MDGYTKKVSKKEEAPANEIKVSNKGKIQSYLSYAKKALTDDNMESITIKATGAAIVKAHILIEHVKRKVGGLH